MEIHILLEGEHLGPFSEIQVRKYLGEGLVSPSDLATYEGMQEWQSLGQVLASLAHLPVNLPAAGAIPRAPTPPRQTVPTAPAPPPHFNMQNDASESLLLTSAPLPAAPSPPLTATQKTKRKLNKIVLQPILPLEPAFPIPTRKKPKTGKTALTLEPLRPTTALPPVTEAPPQERKTRSIPARHISFKDFAQKTAPIPAKPSLPAQVTPSAVSNGSPPAPAAPPSPPDPLPIPKSTTRTIAAKASRTSFSFRRIPRQVIYIGAGAVFILICVILALCYLLSTPSETTPAASIAEPVITLPAPGQSAPNQAGTTEPSPTTAADYSDRGLTRQVKNDLDGAISDYDQALSLDPNNVTAFYRRGLARQAKGDLAGATADYTQVLALDPKNADAFSNRGFIKQTQGDLDGAIADYTQALLLNPKIPKAYFNEGLINVQKGYLDAAIADYNHAIDLDPKMDFAYYNRGVAKNTEGDLDGAIADYTQTLALNPKIALAYSNRGQARQAKGDVDGALADYAQALALNPKMPDALYNRGLIEMQRGDLEGTIADNTQVIELDPQNGPAYSNRGLARWGKDNLDGSLADLRKYCELAPRDSGTDVARLYIWLISAEESPKGDADQELSTSMQNDWNSPPEDLTSKIAAFLLGHIDENNLIANAASPDPKREPGQYCKAWYFAGMKRLLSGDTNTAINYFQKCLATNQKEICEYTFAQTQLQALGQSREIAAKPESGP